MIAPFDCLIESSVSCTKCGAKGVGTCNCWERCSTKVKYGKYNRKTKRYE